MRIGAYCRVRPNTVLASGVELGTHAEVKNSTVGAGTRINHFSCVLDSDVGEDVNIGAGTVTCNYDGSAKYRTVIGDRVFVGTNSTLVAPVRLGRRLLRRRRLVHRPRRATRGARGRPEPPAQHRGMGGAPAGAVVNNSNPYGELLLLSGSGNPELSERIAREIGVKLAECEITRFADGEFDVKIRESVRGHDVFLVQPTCHPGE